MFKCMMYVLDDIGLYGLCNMLIDVTIESVVDSRCGLVLGEVRSMKMCCK